jgi:hypothetical protein
MSIIRVTEKDLSRIVKQVINNSNKKKSILKEDCVQSMVQIDPNTGKPAYIDTITGKYCNPNKPTTPTPRGVNPAFNDQKSLTDLIVTNSNNKNTVPPEYVKKIRLIFPDKGVETTMLKVFESQLLSLGIITGFYTSLSSAISFINTLIKKNVKADEFVIGSHGVGTQLLMTQAEDDNFTFDNSFLNSFRPLIHSNTKVFFTACHGADNLFMLKNAAETLGVGAYAASGVYNYITNTSEQGFYWCSAAKTKQLVNRDEVITKTYGIKNNPRQDYNIFFRFALPSTTNSSVDDYLSEHGAYITIKDGVFDKPIPKKFLIPLDSPDDQFGLNSSLYSDKSYYTWKDVYGVFDKNQEKFSYVLITQKIVDIGNATYNGILKIIMNNKIIGDSKNDNVILRKQKKLYGLGVKPNDYWFNNFVKEKIESNEILIHVMIDGKLTNIKSIPEIKIPNRKKITNKFLIDNAFCKKVPKAPISFTNVDLTSLM